MKNIINLKIIPIILTILIILSCDARYKKHIVGRYYLTNLDYIDKTTRLSYRLKDGNTVGVIKKTVFAVGYNKDYIIVKQYPEYKRAITNYYIVPIYKEYTLWPTKGVIGPLTFINFKEKRKELNILDDVKFTIELENIK